MKNTMHNINYVSIGVLVIMVNARKNNKHYE
jgi:hypothetical protein